MDWENDRSTVRKTFGLEIDRLALRGPGIDKLQSVSVERTDMEKMRKKVQLVSDLRGINVDRYANGVGLLLAVWQSAFISCVIWNHQTLCYGME